MIPVALHMARKDRSGTKNFWYFSISGSGSFTIMNSSMSTPSFLISRNLISWKRCGITDYDKRYIEYDGTIYIKAEEKLSGLANISIDEIGVEHVEYCHFLFRSGSTAYLGGNINALISPSKELCDETIGENAFYRTFVNCNAIKGAENLELFIEPEEYNPFDKTNIISANTFRETFLQCTNLETLPKFTNEKKEYITIEKRGCEGMFNLTAIKDASKLKIRNIYDYGCQDMFNNCFSLERGPSEIYGNIGKYGCHRMFFSCNSLFNDQILDLLHVDEHGCLNMYNGCSSITSCVISKSSVPIISGTNGMQYMFYNCSSLGLIRTRQLSFDGCYYWLYGVKESGIFVCDIEKLIEIYPNPNVEEPSLSPYPIETGVSKIPVGWAQEQFTIIE